MRRGQRYMEPEDKAIIQERLRYLLTVEGINQKKAAELCDLHEATVVQWVRKMGLKKTAPRTFEKGKRDPDSLNAFIIKLRHDKDPIYAAVEERYRAWIKPDLKLK